MLIPHVLIHFYPFVTCRETTVAVMLKIQRCPALKTMMEEEKDMKSTIADLHTILIQQQKSSDPVPIPLTPQPWCMETNLSDIQTQLQFYQYSPQLRSNSPIKNPEPHGSNNSDQHKEKTHCLLLNF